jgi:hypothetical protein
MRRTSVLAAPLVTGALLSAPPVSAAPESCAAFGGVVQGDTCRVQASTAEYTIDMTFPLDYPDEQALVEYLTQTRDGFVNVGQTPDFRRIPHEMDVTAESFESAQTRSVVLTLFQDVGSAHPTTWYKSFTYDVGNRRPVTFDTLFAPDVKPLDAIFPIVQRTLEGETGLVGSIPPGDGRDPAHYQNFAVTDDSVIFFFGRAELLPSFAGATSVTLPRNEIPPLQL